jgi:hypothetical protein
VKEQQLLPRIQQSSASTVLTGNHHVWAFALTSISYCFQDVLGVGMHCASPACPMSVEQDRRRFWRIFNDGRSDEPCKQHISLVSLLTLLLFSLILPFRIFLVTASVNPPYHYPKILPRDNKFHPSLPSPSRRISHSYT